MTTVPKPTQVGRKNILRRARELSLRNSANYPCNFGKKGAYFGDYLSVRAEVGRREMAPATVYQKHSTMQRRQVEVYGVMPAQCRKVKRRC